MAANKLTATSCNAARLAEGEREKLVADGAGLFLYVRPSGKSWLFVFTLDGKRKKMALGPFPAVTLADARERAAEVRALVAKGIDPVALRDAPAASQKTLGDLIDAYLGTLIGKPSHRQAESLFRIHVPQVLKDTPAAQITTDDLAELLSKLVAAGKLRSAAVLRSYTARAFKLAYGANRNPNTPPALRGFGLTVDPAASLVAIEGGTGKTHERCLSVAELRDYAQRLEAMPTSPEKDVALIALYAGGQRISQLLRGSVSLDGSVLILMDGKGRRTQPRLHRIPITQNSKLAKIIGKRTGRLWDIPEAEIEDAQLRVSGLVRQISKAMETPATEGAKAGEHFNARDLRRSIESALVAAGVSLDVTAQLLSHALGGLQHRNYLRHDFDAEKRRALALLEQIIDGTGAVGNVVPMPATA
ncbi:integrase family protein [Dechloromonas sp. H13]|uniref:tyrosine-type recombinase/integrase n=1 Tax=Dechloromonas sp. H13 TaxID=2570193 RepID=UPI00129152E7|nr:integrase family protein [Dechloromonas sp. H13]